MQEEFYRNYIADSFYYQARQQGMTKKYSELLNDAKNVDNRTGNEIAEDIIKKLNLKVTGVNQ